MSTDHYAEAERLLAQAEEATSDMAWDSLMRNAQVHATLATVQRDAPNPGPEPGTSPEPVRNPYGLAIPWPPSDELVERVTHAIWKNTPGTTITGCESAARAVLDAIGGDHE